MFFCSAVRDAAIECLEEVYKVYGEQLMDVLNSHQLRQAHLNLIFSRLGQLGAAVQQSPEQSCEGTLMGHTLNMHLSGRWQDPPKMTS